MATWKISLKRRKIRADEKNPSIIRRNYRVRKYSGSTPLSITETELMDECVWGTASDDESGISVPSPYEYLETGSSYYCTDIEADSESETNTVWNITAKFKYADRTESMESPMDEPANISYGHKKYRISERQAYAWAFQNQDADGNVETVTIDLKTKDDQKGVPIQNTLGAEPEEYPIRVLYNPIINIQRNEYEWAFNPEDIQNYVGTINLNQEIVAGMTIDPGYGKITKIDSDRKYYKERGSDGSIEPYYSVKYQIEINPHNGHIAKLLNSGKIGRDPDSPSDKIGVIGPEDTVTLAELKAGAGKEKNSYSREDLQTVKMDEDGEFIIESFDNKSVKCTWLRFQLDPAINWGPLELPSEKDGD